MDAETEDFTNDAEMPEEIAEACANALVDLHAEVTQAEEYFTPMEETATCKSNSAAHQC